MGDKSEIKVVISGDASSLMDASGKGRDAIANLGQDTGKAAEKTDGLGVSARGLHSALRLIARESGPAMGSAVAGAAALMTGGLFTAVLAVRELFQWITALQKKAEEFREAQAALWLAAEQGARDAAAAAQEFNDKLNDENEKSETLKTAFENQKNLLDTQIEAHKKILEAIEKEALAEAKGDKAKEAAVKDRFEKLKADAGMEGDKQKIALEQKQLGELQIDKLGADLGARTFEKTKENLLAQGATLKAELANFTKEHGDPEKITAAATAAGSKEDLQARLDSGHYNLGYENFFRKGLAAIATAEKYQGISGAIATNDAALKEADRGLGKAQTTGTGDAGSIATLTATIAENTAELRIHRQTATHERALSILGEHGGAAGLVGAVAGNEQILQHGGKLSADQIATNSALVELLGILGATGKQTLEIIHAIGQDSKALHTEIAVLRSQFLGQSNHTISH